MKRKIFISDLEELKIKGRQIMEATNDSRFYNRVAAVNAVLSGVPAAQAAAWFNMTGRSLNGWVKKADESGFESLRDKPRPGAPKKLNPIQLEKVDKMLQESPAEYGFKVWDGPSLSAAIKQLFSVEVGVRQCQRLFHELGYSLIRPQTYPSKGLGNNEARENFQKKESR